MSWLKMGLVGILTALCVQAFDGWVNPPRRFATVDVMWVVQEQIDRLAKESVEGDEVARQTLGPTVDALIQELANHYGVTIMVNQAVVGGDIPDLTEELRTRLHEIWHKN